MPEQKWQFEQDGLIINASRANGRGTVAWCGVSDSRTPGLFLRPVLRELSEKMKGAEVTVDFTKLDYMNSATVLAADQLREDAGRHLHTHPGRLRPDRLATHAPAVHAGDRHDPAPHGGRERAAPRGLTGPLRFTSGSPPPRRPASASRAANARLFASASSA